MEKAVGFTQVRRGQCARYAGPKNPEFDGYKFIAVDSVGSVKFEHLIIIGINGSERKIAYICYNNLTYDNPLTNDWDQIGEISLKSFIERKCGWIRHNRVKEKALSEKN